MAKKTQRWQRLEVGDRVEVSYAGKSKCYRGTVTKLDQDGAPSIKVDGFGKRQGPYLTYTNGDVRKLNVLELMAEAASDLQEG